MAGDVNDDGDGWLLELEVALLDDCDNRTIERICQGRVLTDAIRPETWQVCLNVKDTTDTIDPWTEIYDLPEQNVIRKDVQEFVERLGNEDEDKVSVVSNLESIITTYSKAKKEPYTSDNGWLDILQQIITLKLSVQQLYNVFSRIMTCYIPKKNNANIMPAHIFRLLLLYHEPELCSFLDTKKINADSYSSFWFKTWFGAQCDLKVTLALWDICLQRSNPFFVFYLALVLLVNLKDNIISMKDEKKSDIIEFLKSAPCSLELNDVEDFCSLAVHYAIHTPHSFSTDYCSLMFTENSDINENNNLSDLSQALCIPVSAEEVIKKQDQSKVEGVHFFVVDCRPADQYNNGHLPTAFHLDASLMLQDPSAYHTAVQALFAAQKQANAAESVAGGEHLCFVGSGREEEDQYIHMVIASFLQKNLKYVSIVMDGYLALHEELSDDLDVKMTDHSSKCCIICNPDAGSSTTEGTDSDDFNFIDKGNNLIEKLSSAMKTKSVEVKSKLFEYITNPTPSSPADRHVSSSDKLGKRYRNVASVFSIGDDPDDLGHSSDNEDAAEVINISVWLKKPDVVNSFKCHEVRKNGYMFASYLLVTLSHLFILRELEDRKGFAQITGRRPLSNIVKITSKRKHPELITFKYGYVNEDDGIEITDIDRFLIPNAGEATKFIKQKIVQQMEKDGK